MKLFRQQKGFTLVEMVLYVSLCSIILLSLSMFLTFLLEARVKSQAITEVNQQGLQVVHLVTQTIRNGRSVEVPSVGGSSSTLSVTTASSLLNPTLFSISSTTLFIKEGGGPSIPLTNSRVKVSSLLFENVSSPSSGETMIRVSFTLDYRNPEGKGEYSFTKKFTSSATLR